MALLLRRVLSSCSFLLIACNMLFPKKEPAVAGSFLLICEWDPSWIPRNAEVIQQPLRLLQPLQQRQLQQPSFQQQPFQPSG